MKSEVPQELLSGNHDLIAKYRFIASVKRTLSRRPEFLKDETFSKNELKVLRQHNLYNDVIRIKKGLQSDDVSGID